jgi:rhamnose utilization protein RhaD (predicted bifunctional aldolase and dehydrogenase)
MVMRVPDKLVPDLLATARYGASSLLLAQASGGNNSVKHPAHDLLWVKASGARLADVSAGNGMVALRYSVLKDAIQQEKTPTKANFEWRRQKQQDSVRLARAAQTDSTQGRPSLEVGFHSLLDDVVLHLHPVYVNAFCCMKDGRHFLSEIASEPFLWVEYATPGYELAIKVCQALRKSAKGAEPSCLVMENHGFVASGRSAREVMFASEEFVSAGRAFFGELPPELITAQPASLDANQAAQRLRSLVHERWSSQSYMIRPACFGAFKAVSNVPQLLETPGPVVPDDVVYGGTGIRSCRLPQLRDLVGALCDAPPEKLAVAIEGVGTVLLARNEKLARAMEETLFAHALIRILVARKGMLQVLPAAEIDYLQSMEDEHYRLKVMAKGTS